MMYVHACTGSPSRSYLDSRLYSRRITGWKGKGLRDCKFKIKTLHRKVLFPFCFVFYVFKIEKKYINSEYVKYRSVMQTFSMVLDRSINILIHFFFFKKPLEGFFRIVVKIPLAYLFLYLWLQKCCLQHPFTRVGLTFFCLKNLIVFV